MRIFNRADFLKLPAGTIYCSGTRWVFGEFAVKRETCEGLNDFICLNLQWIEAESSGEAFDELESMLSKGASFPMQESPGRDGCFDDDEIYLVYERADLKRLIGYCQQAISVSGATAK